MAMNDNETIEVPVPVLVKKFGDQWQATSPLMPRLYAVNKNRDELIAELPTVIALMEWAIDNPLSLKQIR